MKGTRECLCGCSRLTIKVTLFLQHFRCWAWQFHFRNYLYSQKSITAFPLFPYMIFCLYFIKSSSSIQAWFQTIGIQSGKILSKRDCSFLSIKISFCVPTHFYLSLLFQLLLLIWSNGMTCRGDLDESYTWRGCVLRAAHLTTSALLIIHQSPLAALDPDSRPCHIKAKASYSCCPPLETQKE